DQYFLLEIVGNSSRVQLVLIIARAHVLDGDAFRHHRSKIAKRAFDGLGSIRDEFAEDLSALLQSFVARDCERRKQCSRKDDPSFDVRHDRMTRAASPSARQIHNAPWSSLLRDAVRPARS